MPAKYFSVIRNYVLSVSLQRKYNFYHQNTLLDAFRTNSRNIIGRNPSMVIPLLANQDLLCLYTVSTTDPLWLGTEKKFQNGNSQTGENVILKISFANNSAILLMFYAGFT